MSKKSLKSFQLIESINLGFNTDIYLATRLDRFDKFVVLKIPKTKKGKELLRNEYKIYQILRQKSSKLIGFVRCDGDPNKFLVMQKLDKNLDELFKIHRRNFPMNTILNLAIEMISRVETLHRINFVHRDLKPQNFMIDRSRIYLIDFEQSKSFLLSNGRHIIPGETRCLFGSMMFTSINSHFYKEMSRKDDMESLAYILCYFLHGRLPWNFYEHLRMDLMQKSLKIGSMKQSLLPHILFENCPIEFSDFLSYVRNLDFEQEPDYEMLRSKFSDLFAKSNLNKDEPDMSKCDGQL
ncbi:protein-tyrosine kinase 2-beta-like [Sarcoptes scabiei]|nr:protein-tyrosine kinase 2-beta-like [Sarcoptes scabiei]